MKTHKAWFPSTKEWKVSHTQEDRTYPNFLRPHNEPLGFPYHIPQAGQEECAGVSCSCSSCASGSGPSSRPAADLPPARRTRRWCRWSECSRPQSSSGASLGSSTRMLAWGQWGNLSADGHGPHNTSGDSCTPSSRDTSVTCPARTPQLEQEAPALCSPEEPATSSPPNILTLPMCGWEVIRPRYSF